MLKLAKFYLNEISLLFISVYFLCPLLKQRYLFLKRIVLTTLKHFPKYELHYTNMKLMLMWLS